MRFTLAVLVCLFFAFNLFAQSENAENEIGKVESIALMRDDGGEPGVETESFKTTDKPIHFQVALDSVREATVTLKLAAVEVKGLKAETKILTINYKTESGQNIINFQGSPKTVWLAGKYRVDVSIDGKVAGRKEFEITKSGATADERKSFAAPKPKPKRKN